MTFLEFIFSIPVWGWLDVGFTLLVLLGVIGESDWAKRKLVRDDVSDIIPKEIRENRIKKIAESLLIVGIGGELMCLAFSLFESAALNKQANEARLKLEQRVASNAPANQSVRPMSAILKLSVLPSQTCDESRVSFSTLIFCEKTNVSVSSFPILEGIKISSWGNTASKDLFIDFREPTWGASEFDSVRRAGDLREIDCINISALFLPIGSPVLGGSLTVSANSLSRKFTIPPQRVSIIWTISAAAQDGINFEPIGVISVSNNTVLTNNNKYP